MKIQYFNRLCKCGIKQGPLIKALIKDYDLDVDFEEYTSFEEAEKAGVPEVPAMVIDGEVITSGYDPSYKELTKILKKLKK